MDAEIRLVDLFEAVLERPYLYTLDGSYQEAIAYLEGCQNSFMHHRPDGEPETSTCALEIQRHQLFSAWLAGRYGSAGGKEAFRRIGEQAEHPSETLLGLYREFRERS